MKELRLCDNAEVKKVFNFCTNHYLGIEIQGFYNPNLINSAETLNLISAYNNVLFDFQGGKSLHAPFWDLNLGTANTMIKESTMKTFNYAYNVAKELECTEIVVHNGFIPNTSFYHSWVKNATDFWKKFFINKDNSIAIMVENQCEEMPMLTPICQLKIGLLL